MKLYKVLDKDCKAKDGGCFDYKEYLPNGKKKGKWTPIIKDIKECSEGYHVTPYWNVYVTDTSNRIFEVECKGIIDKKDEVGVIDKYVCESFRIISELKVKFDNHSNTGDWNTGHCNTGDWNTGHCNTGDWNTGHCNTEDCNTGDYNTGDSNTGDYNTGNRNTGYRNTGNRNTGDRNIGHSNTGDYNTGNSNTGNSNTGNRNTGVYNTGNRNTGNSNTGHWNTGDCNTGDWNICNGETGYFNSIKSKTVRVFNKEILREVWINTKKPVFIYFELKGDYKESFIKSFKDTTKEDVDLLLKLPNFDYKVFEEISGITKKMIEDKLKGD
jgi:hypothetical protein